MRIFFHIFSGFFLLVLPLVADAWMPDIPLHFPRDDAAHHAGVPYPVPQMTEWWYYNGKIATSAGRQFGYSLTVYNITMNIVGTVITVPLLFMQLTDIDRNQVYGKFEVVLPQNASCSTQHLDIRLNHRELHLFEKKHRHYLTGKLLSKQGVPVKFSFVMKPHGPVLLEGKNGLVTIDSQHNGVYYANTRMHMRGSLQVGDEVFIVDEARSSSWMEHVWGDFMLSPGYPWFFSNIRLDNGVDLNLVNMLDAKTLEPTELHHINIRWPDGKNTYLATGMTLRLSSEIPWPQQGEISVAASDIHLHVSSLANNQDANGWWEGISDVSGTVRGKPVHGFAYVQITAGKPGKLGEVMQIHP